MSQTRHTLCPEQQILDRALSKQTMARRPPWKLIIFDADGTLRRCTVEGQPCPNNLDEWEIIPGVLEKLQAYCWGPDLLMGIASNQGGVSLGYLSEDAACQMLLALYTTITSRLPNHGLLQVCPHTKADNCRCRKPHPGMLEAIMRSADCTPEQTLFVGDQDSDRCAAEAAGCAFEYATTFFRHETGREGEKMSKSRGPNR